MIQTSLAKRIALIAAGGLVLCSLGLLVVQRNDCHYWFVSRARLCELFVSNFCSTCRIVRRHQGGDPGKGQEKPSPVVLGLEEIRFHARIRFRPPDRIHNTISLRLFPWDGRQKDGRRCPFDTAIDLRLRPVQGTDEIINNAIHECWLDACDCRHSV